MWTFSIYHFETFNRNSKTNYKKTGQSIKYIKTGQQIHTKAS